MQHPADWLLSAAEIPKIISPVFSDLRQAKAQVTNVAAWNLLQTPPTASPSSSNRLSQNDQNPFQDPADRTSAVSLGPLMAEGVRRTSVAETTRTTSTFGHTHDRAPVGLGLGLPDTSTPQQGWGRGADGGMEVSFTDYAGSEDGFASPAGSIIPLSDFGGPTERDRMMSSLDSSRADRSGVRIALKPATPLPQTASTSAPYAPSRMSVMSNSAVSDTSTDLFEGLPFTGIRLPSFSASSVMSGVTNPPTRPHFQGRHQAGLSVASAGSAAPSAGGWGLDGFSFEFDGDQTNSRRET